MLGRTIGNYVVTRQIGQGGMGAVYLAEHPRIGRKVAVKVVLPQGSMRQELVRRFFQEARAAAAVASEHIVTVLDFGELPDGESYMIMEWLEGRTLAAALEADVRFDHRRASRVARGIGSALAAAHAAGIVHRDLKPENVFLVPREGDPEFVKVLDFGIAKLTTEASVDPSVQTQIGSMMGTPYYMSPEQFAGIAVDHRADIYAFGVILYRMVTGTLPFRAASLPALMQAHMTAPPRPPRELDPSLPPSAEAAILRALEKDPARRFPDVGSLVEAFASGAGTTLPFGARGETRPMTLPAAPPGAIATPPPMAPPSGAVPAATPIAMSATSSPGPAPRRSGLLLGGAALVLLLGGGGIAVVSLVAVYLLAGAAASGTTTWSLASTDCPSGWMAPVVTSRLSGDRIEVYVDGALVATGTISSDGSFRSKGITAPMVCTGQSTETQVDEVCTLSGRSCRARYVRR